LTKHSIHINIVGNKKTKIYNTSDKRQNRKG
jgi:hypothetical protein